MKTPPSPLSSPSRGEDGSKTAPPLREGMKGRVIFEALLMVLLVKPF